MAKARLSDVPSFKYHPNPFSSGALVESSDTCQCCGLARGCLYTGPVYCIADVEGLCPWCIADGSAHARWDAEFTDAVFIDSQGSQVELPADVFKEVLHRTPGVVGACQAVRWWVHCGSPAEFLGVQDERVRFRCGVCGKEGSYQDLD